MELRARRYLVGSVAILTIALAACLVTGYEASRPPHRRLKDGTELYLAAVTYGTSHQLNYSDVQRTHGLFSGPGGWNSGDWAWTPRPALVAWTLRRGAALSRSDLRLNGFVTDEHGCWFDEGHWEGSGSEEQLQWTSFYNYPRRGSTVTIGWVGELGGNPLATFVVRNPTPGEYPQWQGEPLPVRRRSREFDYILTRLGHDEEERDYRHLAWFEVRNAGRIDPAWKPSSITVSDATGNRETTAVEAWNCQHGVVRFGGLCRQEHGWKLKVSFKHPADGRGETVEFLVDPRTATSVGNPVSPGSKLREAE